MTEPRRAFSASPLCLATNADPAATVSSTTSGQRSRSRQVGETAHHARPRWRTAGPARPRRARRASGRAGRRSCRTRDTVACVPRTRHGLPPQYARGQALVHSCTVSEACPRPGTPTTSRWRCGWPTTADPLTHAAGSRPSTCRRDQAGPDPGQRRRPGGRAAACAGLLASSRPADGVVGEEEGGESPDASWPGGAGSSTPSTAPRTSCAACPCGPRSSRCVDGTDVVVGVVSAPALGRRWWAARGAGAWATAAWEPGSGAPRRLRVSGVRGLGRRLAVVLGPRRLAGRR